MLINYQMLSAIEAVDANCEALLKLMSSLNIECRILRSYRPMTEVRKFLSKAKKSERQPESGNGETGSNRKLTLGSQSKRPYLSRPSLSCSRWHRILIRRDAMACHNCLWSSECFSKFNQPRKLIGHCLPFRTPADPISGFNFL